ncbi:hypothetical protein CCR75_008004 [Bremia lactucae]|uniref:Pseudouridine synthase RsuA/RluA-like domain-containing protein n=1 Tax=Bremia lactucae TaxID=4779 RepID=A0A976FH53_BRELC|nr:hypothetical protein CCR75_008004 [Bremia lactucae]
MTDTDVEWQHYEVTADVAEKSMQWVQVAAQVFPELHTISKAKRARKKGNLLFNGQQGVSTLARASINDTLAYYSLESQNQSKVSSSTEETKAQRWLKTCQTQGLRVVYECNSLAVIVKPGGIHVKGRGNRTVERALPLLLYRPAELEGDDFALVKPHAVHRLDNRVGGLLLVAKTRKMENILSGQFERHSVTKHYRAILVGDVAETFRLKFDGSDIVNSTDLPSELRKIRDELIFLDGLIEGKPCLSLMKIVSTTRSARFELVSTVNLWPLTGRKHQLRIHTATYGHPIVGDDLYHNTAGSHEISDNSNPPVVRGMGLFLHSIGIAFDDAVGNRRQFSIEEPNKFDRFRFFCDLNWKMRASRRQSFKDSIRLSAV